MLWHHAAPSRHDFCRYFTISSVVWQSPHAWQLQESINASQQTQNILNKTNLLPSWHHDSGRRRWCGVPVTQQCRDHWPVWPCPSVQCGAMLLLALTLTHVTIISTQHASSNTTEDADHMWVCEYLPLTSMTPCDSLDERRSPYPRPVFPCPCRGRSYPPPRTAKEVPYIGDPGLLLFGGPSFTEPFPIF